MGKPITHLTWALFTSWRPSVFFEDLYIWFRRLIFLLRHGYCPQARFEMFEWHRQVMNFLPTFAIIILAFLILLMKKTIKKMKRHGIILLTRCHWHLVRWGMESIIVRANMPRKDFSAFSLNITSTCGTKLSQVFLRYKFEFWP